MAFINWHPRVHLLLSPLQHLIQNLHQSLVLEVLILELSFELEIALGSLAQVFGGS